MKNTVRNYHDKVPPKMGVRAPSLLESTISESEISLVIVVYRDDFKQQDWSELKK